MTTGYAQENFYRVTPAEKPRGRRITQKYLDKHLDALSQSNKLLEKRVELFKWIRKVAPSHLAEASVEREDYFDSGLLQIDLLQMIFTKLATIQGVENDFIHYLLANIHDDPLPEIRGLVGRDRSNDLLFVPLSSAGLRGRPQKATRKK